DLEAGLGIRLRRPELLLMTGEHLLALDPEQSLGLGCTGSAGRAFVREIALELSACSLGSRVRLGHRVELLLERRDLALRGARARRELRGLAGVVGDPLLELDSLALECGLRGERLPQLLAGLGELLVAGDEVTLGLLELAILGEHLLAQVQE